MEPAFVNPTSKAPLVSFVNKTTSLDLIVIKVVLVYTGHVIPAQREMVPVYLSRAFLVSMVSTVTSVMFHVGMVRSAAGVTCLPRACGWEILTVVSAMQVMKALVCSVVKLTLVPNQAAVVAIAMPSAPRLGQVPITAHVAMVSVVMASRALLSIHVRRRVLGIVIPTLIVSTLVLDRAFVCARQATLEMVHCVMRLTLVW